MLRDWSAPKVKPKLFVETDMKDGDVGFEGLGFSVGPDGFGFSAGPDGFGFSVGPEGLPLWVAVQALLERVNEVLQDSHWRAAEGHVLQFGTAHGSSK